MGKLLKPSTQLAVVPAADLGAKLIALSGLGFVGYGILILIWNFTSFIELGLTPAMVGSTREQIAASNPLLYHYISHIQVALAGLLIAVGIAITALAWFGIRTGQRWALWTAFGTPAVALLIGLPLHFVYGLDSLGHLGPVYADFALLLIGAALAHRALNR